MRVLQLGDVAGVSYKLARLLVGMRVDVGVLVCGPGIPYPAGSLGDRVERLAYSGKLSNLRLLWRLATRYRGCDLYHAHSLMSIVAMGMGLPYVAHFHGSDVRETREADTLQGRLIRLAMRRARRCLYCTPDLEAGIRAAGVDPARMIWLPNPVDSAMFRRLEDRPPPLAADFATVVFHPQRMQPVRRNEVFFKGFARVAADFPDAGVVLVGHATSGEDHGRMLGLIRELGIAGRCRVIPWIPPDRMAAAYNAADIVVDFFRKDLPAVSQTTLEAMSCEKPVIAGIPTEGISYLRESPIMPGGTVAEIEESLRRLLSGRDAWAEIGRRSRSWVERHHGTKVVGDRLLALYREVLADGTAPVKGGEA